MTGAAWCLSVCLSVCSTTAGRARTSIEMDSHQLQLRSDVLVKCFAVHSVNGHEWSVNGHQWSVNGQLSRRPADSTLLFRCQFHTSALTSHSLEFSASDLDLESPAQGQGQGQGRSLDGLRVQFNFSSTTSSPACCEYRLNAATWTVERCKLPQRGPGAGAEPQPKSNLVHFSLKI